MGCSLIQLHAQEEYRYFPTVVLTSTITGIKSVKELEDNGLGNKNVSGNLYTGEGSSGGDVIYAYTPTRGLSSCMKFYEGEERDGWLGWFKDKGEKAKVETGEKYMDEYVKNTVVPSLVSSPESVTIFGLSCAEGSLFESEFYLQQNVEPDSSLMSYINSNFINESYSKQDIVLLRKAFLFLHSLPTSEYKALGQTLGKLMKRTYTPSVADIPLASALFIGALLWRDKANGEVREVNHDKGNTDNFLVYGKRESIGGENDWSQAGSRQLITYKEAVKSMWGSKESHNDESGGYIRRPLNPIIDGDGKQLEYLSVTNSDVERSLVQRTGLIRDFGNFLMDRKMNPHHIVGSGISMNPQRSSSWNFSLIGQQVNFRISTMQ